MKSFILFTSLLNRENLDKRKFLIKSSPALEELLVSGLAELILLYLFNDFNFNFYVFVLVVTKN